MKHTSHAFPRFTPNVVEGMFLFASFRIGIYTTTLGVNLGKAWLVCFIQPIAMLLAMTPTEMWISVFTDPLILLIGF